MRRRLESPRGGGRLRRPLAAATRSSALGHITRDIRPILAENWPHLHGPDSAARKADLRLDRREAAIEAGAIVASEPESSELIGRINASDPKELMPANSRRPRRPPSARRKSSWPVDRRRRACSAALVADPAEAARPAEGQGRVVGPQPDRPDRASEARAEQLHPRAEADRRTLARRLSLDLTGLPPAPELVDAFVNDPSPRAYEDLVTRLLDSPRCRGEALHPDHWLDAARYAGTADMLRPTIAEEAWGYRATG